MGAKRKIRRGQVCAAFEHLVEVCQAHVSIWCAHELSNKAMSRLFNSVELLRAETRDREKVVVEPEGSAEGMPHWQSSRPDFYLHRIVERLDKVYDRLITPANVEAPALAFQLPPREQMPTEPTELVRFARQVCEILLAHPAEMNAARVYEGTPVLINAALRDHARSLLPKRPPQERGRSMYERQLNACLRMLVEKVDPALTRYRSERAFIKDYKAARRQVEKLLMPVRQTYFVKGAGLVSARHPVVMEFAAMQDPPLPS